MEFEKKIESRHITRAHGHRSDELIGESKTIISRIDQDAKWSDLALKLYDYYLKTGHVKNKSEYESIKAFFENSLPQEKENLSFHGKIYTEQSYAWYYYITQEFSNCYKYAKRWLLLFERQPEFQVSDPILYMKGYHNLLSALFFCLDQRRFAKALATLQNFIRRHEANFTYTQNATAFLYLQTAALNQFFIKGEFTKGAQCVDAINQELEKYSDRLDEHRILIFWYKMGCLKFGSADYKGALVFLNKIINNPTGTLREDVQCFARILSLVSHYELGNDDLIDHQIRNTYRFLLKYGDLQRVQKAILDFLKRSVFMERKDLKPHFAHLKKQLESFFEDKFEARPLLYLDLISWLESKIESRPVEQIIQEKMKKIG